MQTRDAELPVQQFGEKDSSAASDGDLSNNHNGGTNNVGKETVDVEEVADELIATVTPQERVPDAVRPAKRWIFVAICHELTWGLYPVSTRYIQVALDLDGLLVLCVSFALAFCVVQSALRPGLGGKDGVRIGLCYSLLTLGRGCTNMLSSKFTSALYCQLIIQLTPLVVVMLSKVFLDEPLPKCFFPSVAVATIGGTLVISGQSGLQWSGVSGNDFLGLSLALVSIVFLGAMFVYQKASKSSLPSLVLLSWQFMNALPLGVIAVATSMNSVESLGRLRTLSRRDISICVAFSFYHVLFGNLCQVVSVRKVGPSFMASLQPLRFLSNIVGGYLVLGEPVRSTISWAGLLVISAALTVYVMVQPRKVPVTTTFEGKEPTGSSDRTKYGKVSG